MQKLNKESLATIGWTLDANLSKAKVGIVHLGFGAFHKGHQAWFTNQLMKEQGGDWKIIGVDWQTPEKPIEQTDYVLQDHLYAICTTDNNATKYEVIESIEKVLYSQQTDEVLAHLTAESTKIVSLTITEKGYCHHPATGHLNAEHPLIVHDLQNINQPKTAIGFLVAALKIRKEQGIAPFTPLSCDNLPENGHTLKKVVLDFAKLFDEELYQWIVDHIRFPCTMVDRIVPRMTEEDKQLLANTLNLRDECGVVTEPFCQWIIEDDFCNDRPDWDQTSIKNVVFTKNVIPYEEMKLRLLNGTHSVIAYLGYLAGYQTVAETMQDLKFKTFIRYIMDKEITPSLAKIDGIDLNAYKDSLIERYENRSLKHKTYQIAMDGSQKVPQRWLETIEYGLENGVATPALYLGLAAWFLYSRGLDEQGQAIEVQDPIADKLQQIWQNADSDEQVVEGYLALEEVFPAKLRQHSQFKQDLIQALQQVKSLGAKQTIHTFII